MQLSGPSFLYTSKTYPGRTRNSSVLNAVIPYCSYDPLETRCKRFRAQRHLRYMVKDLEQPFNSLRFPNCFKRMPFVVAQVLQADENERLNPQVRLYEKEEAVIYHRRCKDESV